MPCGAGVARSCGRGGSGGARQQPVLEHYAEVGMVAKIRFEIFTMYQRYMVGKTNKDKSGGARVAARTTE